MHYVTVKGILSAQNGMNLYRGCTHGCIYCDSRSRCYGMEHAFEDVEVKENALVLLEAALRKKRRPCMIATGSMTDPYLNLEERLCYTRRALELIDRYGFGFTCITKSARVLRDLDLLQSVNRKTKAVVQMTLTTADEALCKLVEPHVSTTRERFAALLALRDAGIPTVVWLCPILPFLNDTEENVAAVLDMCVTAGVRGVICFGMGMTLREGDREYFYAALDRHFPGMKERYARRYGNAYALQSPNAAALSKIFRDICERGGMLSTPEECFAFMQELPEKHRQLSMFDL